MKGYRAIVSMLMAFWLASFFSASALAASLQAEGEREPEKGPNNGRMLRDGNFAVELAIFETGVPPEYRAWITRNGEAVPPQQVTLKVVLTRLGDIQDNIRFSPQGNFLRGDMEIYEPHSFTVTVTAEYAGATYQWQYDSFEGRTSIEQAVADAMGVVTEVAGPAVLHETVTAYGRLILPPAGLRELRARFDGQISRVHRQLGEFVREGDALLTIESNESLRAYTIRAPISGVLAAMDAAAGEQARDRVLARLMDVSHVQAELSVFPLDQQRVKPGAAVTLRQVDGGDPVTGKIVFIEPGLTDSQAQRVRVAVEQRPDGWLPGQFVSAAIEVAQHPVGLAVKRSGLQGFRDFTVVFAKVGEQYEVRMLELGRQDNEWVEVLDGLEPGTEYVSENSFLLKADVEKSGASHDH